MLDSKHLYPLTLSSSAPAYSAVVTAPIIVSFTGMWSVGVYLLAGILSWSVAQMFSNNTGRTPSKGTVYSWNRGPFAWLNGYALAVSGIVATSGLAYVAATGLLYLIGVENLWVTLALAAALIVAAPGLNPYSLKATSLGPMVSLLAHLAAGIALIVLMFVADHQALYIEPGAGGVVKAILIAVFAYWGFDTAFALAEESEPGAPVTAARLSVITMGVTFVLVATVIALYGVAAVLEHPLVVLAVSLSAIMSLGSTLLPTIRGVEAMAEQHDLPNLFAHGLRAEVTTAGLATIFIAITVFHEGFFFDLVDCLSLFVGFYYCGAIFASWKASRRTGELVLLFIMAVLTVGAGIFMLTPTYGNTVVGGISGVAVIGAVLAVLGVGLYGVNRALKPVNVM